MLPDPYPVSPWTRPCRGEVQLPGSKSLTNRALILAALSRDRIRLTGALFSRDSRILCDSLEILGFEVFMDEAGGEILIKGNGGVIPRDSAELFVGNAGTAARFLTALVCLHPSGNFRLDGDLEMRARPMEGLIRTLEAQGAQFSFEGESGCFPFTVRTKGLSAGEWTVDSSASSQMLSALMMVAPCAEGPVRIKATEVRPAFVQMTARLMEQFSIGITGSPEEGYEVPVGQAYSCPGGNFAIEPDVTAASYFMVLPYVVGGHLKIGGLHRNMLQGDLAFAEVLQTIGMLVEEDTDGWSVRYGQPPSDPPASFCFETFSDTFLTLAAIAPLLKAPVRIEGIGHTRFQETDRIAAMTLGLREAGAEVLEEEAAISVRPYSRSWDESLPPASIKTFKDHRLAMSFAILGCRPRGPAAKPWLEVLDPECCSKTFPGFFEVLESLYRKSHDVWK